MARETFLVPRPCRIREAKRAMGTRMGSFPGTELLLKSRLWNLVYRLMVLAVRQDANKAIYTNRLLSVVSVYNCTLTFRKEARSIGKSCNKQMRL